MSHQLIYQRLTVNSFWSSSLKDNVFFITVHIQYAHLGGKFSLLKKSYRGNYHGLKDLLQQTDSLCSCQSLVGKMPTLMAQVCFTNKHRWKKHLDPFQVKVATTNCENTPLQVTILHSKSYLS